jgi:hypothetical protein
MKTNIIVFFALTIFLLGCMPTSKKTYNSKLTIRYDLKKLTGLELDTAQFYVLKDSIHHTEGAFDSDYTWYVKIKFTDSYFSPLKDKIRYSPYFDLARYEYDDNWKKIDTTKITGVWCIDSAEYRFVQKPLNFNPEPIYLSVDTINRILDLKLMHL